ncbi:hypothetical protein [Sphingomonas phage Kimi]|nr:hypothetical protein [Sphingomonas phage Kimi]
MAKHDHCIRCGGVGLLRNENPHSSRVYGEHCPDCNGTGVASNPVWQFNACLGYIVFIIGVVYLVVRFWP